MKTPMQKSKPLLIMVMTVLLGIAAGPATAALNPTNFEEELAQLVIDGNVLLADMENMALSSFSMASQVSSLETSVQTYLYSVGNLYKTVAASTDNTTMSLTGDMLVPLQTLATISASLSQGLMNLSGQMVNLAPYTALTTLDASLASMLRLSDDIGVMADRILEMADKILIMADNIGIMADRILATQVIQSDNLVVLVDAGMTTQKNLLMLFSMYQL